MSLIPSYVYTYTEARMLLPILIFREPMFCTRLTSMFISRRHVGTEKRNQAERPMPRPATTAVLTGRFLRASGDIDTGGLDSDSRIDGAVSFALPLIRGLGSSVLFLTRHY